MDQGSQGVFSGWLRERRLAAVLPLLRGRILDVGCGTGVLAKHVAAAEYLGVEPDQDSILKARRCFPNHRFERSLPIHPDSRFDTILALAVIEHVEKPADWLGTLALLLLPEGRIVLTTPHPLGHWVHKFGARIGLFSAEAADEHKQFLARGSLEKAARSAGLRLAGYRRFLAGFNQVCWMERL